MVCVAGEDHGILELWGLPGAGGDASMHILQIGKNVRVGELVHRVSSLCERKVGSFGLLLQWGRRKVNLMRAPEDSTMADIGVDFTTGTNCTLRIIELPPSPADSKELTELSDEETRKLSENGVDLSPPTKEMLLVEVTSESPTNETENEALTPTDDDTATIPSDEESRTECIQLRWRQSRWSNKAIYDGKEETTVKIDSDGFERTTGREFRRVAKKPSRSASAFQGKSPFTKDILTGRPNEMQRDEECGRRGTTTGYVGLVNQAMTCYLNSLLQALYMTPEFRNALYNWEYVNEPDKENKSIPYQLQKLFLNLQTSTKTAIETTSLTKSFGWDSTEAWQQHDLQELCRVMFDALEQKFKNTEQADLINRLYEGRMIDYVKCLECGTEKSREDTFLDIPLPVRPFGSNIAYNSVEEALGAFVQPETLDGTNQYHCETCNKKCDAHKGLKFTKFPYFLTLHLKRFDFDYNTFHRIKLNDEVTFPDLLNLNNFIPSPSTARSNISSCAEEFSSVGVKGDNGSTTDSGNLQDDCPPPPADNGTSVSDHSSNENHDYDDDIVGSNGPSTSSCDSHNNENEKNRDNRTEGARGPYEYELFAIMIHSGSASGGHYYAYIKDFETGEWLCFNDQNVSSITYEDIQKTYGGGPTRAYYSGVYSSSTNAYMLMYRQIDSARNALPMQVSDFPKHLQELLTKMLDSEYNERKNREPLVPMLKLKVFCHRPVEKVTTCMKFSFRHDETWTDVTDRAYKGFNLADVADRDQVRLVAYQESSGLVDYSFDGREHETLQSILDDPPELLVEIRKKDEPFQTYLPGGVARKVLVVDFATNRATKGPLNVRVRLSQTVQEFKEQLSPEIGMDPKDINLVLQYPTDPTRILRENSSALRYEGFTNVSRIFVPTTLCPDPKKTPKENIDDILETVSNCLSLNVQLPDVSKEILRDLKIPTLEEKRKEKMNDSTPVINGPTKTASNVEATRETEKIEGGGGETTVKTSANDETSAICNKTTSPRVIQTDVEDWHTPEQSNSEDSSLSYSDRTLVGEGDASEDEDYPLANIDHEPFNRGNQFSSQDYFQTKDTSEYLFNATRDEHDPDKLLRILIDRRMVLGTFKKCLEPYVNVPMEYFRIFRQPTDEIECTRLSMDMKFHDDGDTLWIKLGMALRSDEFKVTLYQLSLDSEIEPYRYLCEWIVSKDATVGQTKKDILAELKSKFNIDIPYERCRLRRKNYKTAGIVFFDDQKIEDLQFVGCNREIIVQELPSKETVTNPNHVVLFVRSMPTSDSHTHGSLQEIVVSGKSSHEVRLKLSEISGIPEEHLEIAEGKSVLPDDLKLLLLQNFLDWGPELRIRLPLTLKDGTVIYYRDRRVKPHELSPEEVRELKTRRKSRFSAMENTPSSRYSPRRERALKIYVDDK